jgi:lipopolysaccharide export system permease protein
MKKGPVWGILQNYIFIQLAVPLCLGMALFTFVFIIQNVFVALAMTALGNIPITSVMRFLVCFIPPLITLTLPMALLLANLVVYGRMTEEREIDAMLTSGVPWQRILLPALALGCLCATLLMGWCHFIAPRTLLVQECEVSRLMAQLNLPILESEKMNFISNYSISLGKVDRESGMVQDAVIDCVSGKTDIAYSLYAPLGQVRLDGASRELNLSMLKGSIHFPSPVQSTNSTNTAQDIPPYVQWHFDLLEFNLDVSSLLDDLLDSKSDREEAMPTLLLRPQSRVYINHYNYNPEANKKYKEKSSDFLTEFYKRFSMPLSCIVLALLGAPLGVLTGLGRKALCFAISIGVIIVYYVLDVLCQNLAQSGMIPISLGVFITPLLFLLVAIAANWKLARR